MSISNEWINLDDGIKEIVSSYQKEFPVPVGAIAKSLGITVKSSTLPASISGEIRNAPNGVVVKINRHDVKARQRFTLAHEIAHFLLHRDLIGDGIVDDVLYRSTLSNALEAEANRLAADIIMPWHLIDKSLKDFSDLKGEMKFEKIAEVAEISVTAIKIRLGKI